MQVADGDELGPWASHAMVAMPDGRMLDAAGPHDASGDEKPFNSSRWLVTIRASGGGRKPWRSARVLADADELLRSL
jgi:hypothetical protein